MKLREILGLSAALLLCLTGCTDKTVSGEHEAVTILAPFLDCDNLAELVHEKYPEVNLEILSYSGANTTQYLQNMLAADDLPDICTQTVYDPNINDMSDKMIDLSSYDFTDNYVESRLQDVSDDGAIYMMDCMEYIQKWKNLGMFTTNKRNPQSDDETRNEFMEGNTCICRCRMCDHGDCCSSQEKSV